MSTGRRLAKRSIIGTKVCAPGPDGLWYSGVIQAVKTPPSSTITLSGLSLAGPSSSSSSSSSSSTSSLSDSGTNLTADTKYIVRFDFKTQSSMDAGNSKSVIMEARRAASVHISPTQTVRRNAMIKEFRESDLIGPGFRSIMGIQLQPGQRVFLTHNGRETSGDVVTHDADKDEVTVKINAIGTEDPIELKKRLEEVRLLESRRSARLADQDRDTDFARLADMGGDRRRTSHSIEVPLPSTPQHNSRKRLPYTTDEECAAAVILMNFSNSPKSPRNGDQWLGSSPCSSAASWSSGSSSPPLSDDGHAIHTSAMLNDASASARLRTTSVSTSDEGIVVDFKEERKKRLQPHKTRFICTWEHCKFRGNEKELQTHIKDDHLINKSVRDREEEFYYITDDDYEEDDDEGKAPSPTSPPTLSHFDMARPPHEDPEYQRQIVGNYKHGRAASTHHNNHSHASHHQQSQHSNGSCMPPSPLAHHNYTWSLNSGASQNAPNSTPTHAANNQQQQHSAAMLIKHARSSPRPSQSAAPYPSPTYVHNQHHNYSSASANNATSPVSHGNSSANNMLQQLSQQNVTVTTHHNGNTQQQHHHQHSPHQLSAVTITPNYHHSNTTQQHIRSHQQTPTATASNNVANANQHTHSAHVAPHIQQHVAVLSTKHSPNSPNRRTRGENKKCRKVYGMEQRDKWCTQCKWKKACSRFVD